MSSTFVKVLFATLLAQGAHALVYTPPPPEPTAGPNCTVTVYEVPGVGIDCTFFQRTTTSTVYTDCHGCDLVTVGLGLGLPCQAIKNIPGTTTKTATSCSGVTPTPTPTPAGDCDDPDEDIFDGLNGNH